MRCYEYSSLINHDLLSTTSLNASTANAIDMKSEKISSVDLEIKRRHILIIRSTTMPKFLEYPLLSQEWVKLRNSNFARTFTGSIGTKAH